MLTFLTMLPNPPPRGWGAQTKGAAKRKKTRKPVRDTSKTTRKKAKAAGPKEVAKVAKRKRRAPRRGAGGRFLKKAGGRKRKARSSRRRKSTTKRRRVGAKRRSSRRRRNPVHPAFRRLEELVGGAAKRRSGGGRKKKAGSKRRRKLGGSKGIYRPSLRVGRKAKKSIKQRLRRAVRGSKLLKSGALRINPRRRRRRKAHSRRRHYGRRRNPGMLGSPLVKTGLMLGQYALGVYIERNAAEALESYGIDADKATVAGVNLAGVGVAGVVYGLLRLAGYNRAAKRVITGAAASVGLKGAIMLKDKLMGGAPAPVTRRAVARTANGLGAVVSAERMITAESRQGLGDFVQLQGPIPRGLLAGRGRMGDYVEFPSQAAGAAAMTAQLASTAPFQPGSEERF